MKHFFPKLLNKVGLLDRINIFPKISVNGKIFTIPVIKKTGYNNLFLSEPWMVQVLDKVLKIKKGTFVDVGVNIGQTLINLRSVDDNREYIGFEPNPVCVFYAEELAKYNNFKNTTFVPVGISDKNDIISLNIYSQNDNTDSAASVIENFRTQKIYAKKQVPLFSVQTVEEILTNTGIIKIDVEGAELEVINSFLFLIKKNNPVVIMEILPSYDKSNIERVQRSEKIVNIFSSLEYDMFRIIKTKNNTLKEYIKIKSTGIHGDINLCDYIFVPRYLSDKFEK